LTSSKPDDLPHRRRAMDAFDCIATKLDVREYSEREVPGEVKLQVLEAGRLTGSGVNRQHWRFVLVQDRDRLRQLARDSTTGGWVEGAGFAVIVLTNPRYGYHRIDAGRAVQDMQLAAWNSGVVSCIFTGFDEDALRKDFDLPEDLDISVIAGFGYPVRRITGRKKSRRPLAEIAFLDRHGIPLDAESLL
jgi:nitroreductase